MQRAQIHSSKEDVPTVLTHEVDKSVDLMDERVSSHILVERVKKFSLIRSTRFSDFSFAYIVFITKGEIVTLQ